MGVVVVVGLVKRSRGDDWRGEVGLLVVGGMEMEREGDAMLTKTS